jgi:hypothetical protein
MRPPATLRTLPPQGHEGGISTAIQARLRLGEGVQDCDTLDAAGPRGSGLIQWMRLGSSRQAASAALSACFSGLRVPRMAVRAGCSQTT